LGWAGAGQYACFLALLAGFFLDVAVICEREERCCLRPPSYFFSTFTFWLSQERPSKMPGGIVSTAALAEVCLISLESPNLTFSAGGATGLDLPHVVLGYSVEVEGLGYVVWSHCCKKGTVSFSFSSEREILKNLPPSTSCLLAKTSRTTLRISRSWMMRLSSDLASSIRVRSQESMTKIRAWVPGEKRCQFLQS
jgi:hypothetical protein